MNDKRELFANLLNLLNDDNESISYWSSWTIWNVDKGTDYNDKINLYKRIGDTSIFKDKEIQNRLDDGFIFVGLNASRAVGTNEPWKSFHTDDHRAKDYKLCYALAGTKYWGSYITDIIKGEVNPKSKEVITKFKTNEVFRNKQISTFRKEIETFDNKNIKLIAIGRATETMLKKYFSCYKIIYIKHYSTWIAKEKYKELIRKTLEEAE